MTKARKSETVGGPPPRGLEVELRRAFAPMVQQVRRAAVKVRTAGQARALGVALRKAWPDTRVRKIVRAIMVKAEQRSSVGWGKWDRKKTSRAGRANKADAVRNDARKPRLNIGESATWPDLNDKVARSISSTYDNRRKITVIEWELEDGSKLTTLGMPDGIKRAAPRVRAAAAAEYDGAALIERQSKAATKLITSVRDEVAETMRKDVVAALELGVDPEELAAGWVREGVPVIHGTLEGRMRVIAQHQLSNLHAAVQAERARAIGATEFRWVTQEDDRVRPAHRARHGRTFTYADPPEGELPGQPVNCRCHAEAIIPDELVFNVGSAFDT